jgi:oxygen-independent coproporphyrinogen-3 oxidase
MRPGHLYVHVPFCSRRCIYCDFSIAVRPVVPVAEYLDGIDRELSLRYPRAGEEWKLDTLYFGGGTPSKLGADGIRKLVETVLRYATLRNDAEVSIEANPEDASPENVQAWAAAGVNRISLGAQSFSEGVLEWMHRTHDAGSIRQSVRNARSAGIENVSLDLIFALPDEVERSWSDDLDRALELEPSHVSLYGLTIEPATPLARWTEERRVSRTPDDRYAEEFLLAHDRLTAAGFEHYEVSNFAIAGRKSRHNSAYWTGAPYAGIGPSAHSFDGANRIWNIKPYSGWLDSLAKGESSIEGTEHIDSENAFTEKVYLGLRTQSGYPVEGHDRATAEQWARAGWAVIDGDLVRLNPEGWLRLDSLAAGLTGS